MMAHEAQLALAYERQNELLAAARARHQAQERRATNRSLMTRLTGVLRPRPGWQPTGSTRRRTSRGSDQRGRTGPVPTA